MRPKRRRPRRLVDQLAVDLLCELDSITAIPAAMRSCEMSLRATSIPASAQTCAIPVPICPAPITPILLMLISSTHHRDNSWIRAQLRTIRIRARRSRRRLILRRRSRQGQTGAPTIEPSCLLERIPLLDHNQYHAVKDWARSLAARGPKRPRGASRSPILIAEISRQPSVVQAALACGRGHCRDRTSARAQRTIFFFQ